MRSRARRALAGLAAGVLGVAACSSDGPSSNAACKSEASVTYENFAGPFFLDWCTGCHSSSLAEGERQEAPMGVDFDTYDDIVRHSPRILDRAVHLETMPPVGGPSVDERQLLREWLDCGAPVETQVFEPPAPPPVVEPPPPMGQCAERPSYVPESLLPRCSAASWQCVADCTSIVSEDDDAVRECQEACAEADLTPGAEYNGSDLECDGCTFEQLRACAAEQGCEEQVALVTCCIEDCFASANPGACFDNECSGPITAFAYCVGFDSPECFDYIEGPMSRCFDRSATPAMSVITSPAPERAAAARSQPERTEALIRRFADTAFGRRDLD